jgi:hypothetical protein
MVVPQSRSFYAKLASIIDQLQYSSRTYPRNLYLDLLSKTITNTIYGDPARDLWSFGSYDEAKRLEGKDWPSVAHSMVGNFRLQNVRHAVETVIRERIPGDLIETGVWRGGVCIFMRGILAAYGVHNRKVLVADSFKGLPVPDEELYPADVGDPHHTYTELAISLEQVKANFEVYGLLDDQVEFIEGWFSDTLPLLRDRKFSVIRLDGDMYGSTMVALENLYPRLSDGGFCIIDDYGAVEGCRIAVEEYRAKNNITAKLEVVDWTGAWWRK